MTGAFAAEIRRARLVAFFLPLLLSAPFLNRAFFVDDGYFVQIAAWLTDHPGEPYDFRTHDAGPNNPGWERDGMVRMVNPLVHHYILSGLLDLGGGRIWVLRLGTVLITGFAALIVFELARRWTSHPLLATALVAVTPAWWGTAHTLLIDSTMGAFLLGGLYSFIRSSELDSLPQALASGVLMGLALLSKYTAVFVFPLTAVWLALNWRKVKRPWLAGAAWLIAAAFLAGYSLWTARLYGKPHFFAASARMVHGFTWPKLIEVSVFLSGSCLVAFAGWLAVSRRARLAGLMGAIALIALFSSGLGGFDVSSSALLGAFIATSLVFLGAIWSRRAEWVWPRDAFLFAWIGGFIAMMLVAMDWAAVRYFFIAAPAVTFAGVRIIELRFGGGARRVLLGALVATGLLTAAVVYADYRQAEPARQLPAMLREKGYAGGERHFYLGDVFTMSYLSEDGWQPCFRDTPVRVGDWVLSREVTMPLIWFARRPVELRPIDSFEFPTRFPIRVMDFRRSAGFYASVWGALPFAWSDGPWERFQLYEVVGVRETPG